MLTMPPWAITVTLIQGWMKTLQPRRSTGLVQHASSRLQARMPTADHGPWAAGAVSHREALLRAEQSRKAIEQKAVRPPCQAYTLPLLCTAA